MRVLVIGATGQLGRALLQRAPDTIGGVPVEVLATSRLGDEACLALDLADADACNRLVETVCPDWVINAAAYTGVDQAEREPELAHAVNAAAPAALAQALQRTGGHLLHLSTDFVFNGRQGSPYDPSHPVDPLGVYGSSKAAGESLAALALSPSQLCILRTSWLYGSTGHNFVLTMLRLMRERSEFGVVADQVGSPTAVPGLVAACWSVVAHQISGTHHWSDAGVASWYDFALAIAEIGQAVGLLPSPARVIPIGIKDYPAPARRPSYSVLDCTSTRRLLQLPVLHWRSALRQVLGEMMSTYNLG